MFSPKPKQCFRVGVLSSPLYCLGCLDFPPGPGPSPPPTNQGRERRGCRGHLGAGPWRRAAVQGSSSATLTYRPGHPDFKRAGRRQRGLGRAFLPTSRRSARALSLSLSLLAGRGPLRHPVGTKGTKTSRGDRPWTRERSSQADFFPHIAVFKDFVSLVKRMI